jgi:hypothetical protein
MSADYDSRALRFENHFGTYTILRGENGPVAGKAEWFKRFDLASVVAPSDKAVAEAREFDRNRTPGIWAMSLGFLVFAFDAILLKVTHDANAVSVVTALGGTALMVYGAERIRRATSALSKALWWYNRDVRKE